jgi:hypothetical protein
MHDPYDRSSKWLIERQGNAILYLGGIRGIQSWRSLQADVVQPRRLPDGLLEVVLHGREDPDLYLLEIATYPENRVPTQILDDALLVLLNRRLVPEVMTLVLCPRGNLRVTGTHDWTSRQGWTNLHITWRVVELWNVPAQDLLAANDIGLIPWVPLTQFEGPPEPILEECRRRIDQQAPVEERANYLAVTQVLARLRYNEPSIPSNFD